ncbi:hypothetical protein BU23DRAFT_559875 [Bimuria novae-zelandiae CBS 107.79]|uniref:YAG7-like dimerisation domain-containing protein n=1 Tax=Bimuria novae-zelandiae CBS 107.79 TaxID=1447943 RepID=A0A6A5USA1_9PLEO|nr:hypothetical protein BU23DRAFT_559875 [Bimuria novae-zelandiae CBS 107.79]
MADAAAKSKSALKKAKQKAAAAIPALSSNEKTTSEFGNGSDAAGKTGAGEDNAYIRELQKSVRNVNKKLNAMSKVSEIVAANPDVPLDELVSNRKINADQKAQYQKKPALESQLAQLEEQLAQYKKFEQELQNKAAQEKEIMQKGHTEELEKLRETLKQEAALEVKKTFREQFLTLSRFLRAAAARRQMEEVDNDLTKAFEGALLQVYGGDPTAVAAAEKLIEGSEEKVPSTDGEILSVTYAQVKQAALDEAPFAAEEAWADDVAQSQPTAPESDSATAISTDPTVANAGLTEIDTATGAVNRGAEVDTPSAPAASSIGAGAANDAGGDWDKPTSGSDDPLAESFEIVPRDPAETETPAAPAAVNLTQSWADDTPDAASAAPAAANTSDGFHEVVHHGRGGRGRGGGGFGGRGRGGPRGDFRGRGRGRGRGDGFRGAPRGGFRGGRGDSVQQ